MTDPHPEDDEIVTAVVDGEASAAEEARVASDPSLRARAAEFRSVADAVAADPVEIDGGSRDRAVGAALDAAAALGDAAGVDRIRRPRRTTVPRPILAAAAGITLLALGAGVIAQLDSGDGDDGAELTESAAPDLAPEPLDLGQVDGNAEIRRQVVEATGLVSSRPAAAEAGAGSAGAPEASAADSAEDTGPVARLFPRDCEITAVEANPDLLGLLAQGQAVYRGVDALVYVYNAAVGTDAVVLVVAADDCRGLDRFVL